MSDRPSFPTKKSAKEAGYLTREKWAKRRTSGLHQQPRAPLRAAVPTIVKGEEFFCHSDCEELISQDEAARRGLLVPADLEPAGDDIEPYGTPGRENFPIFRVSDCIIDKNFRSLSVDEVKRDQKEAMQEIAVSAGKASWTAVIRMPEEKLESLMRLQTDPFKSGILDDALIAKRLRREKRPPHPVTSDEVPDIYYGSSSAATRRLHQALRQRGRLGEIAALAIKAQKSSARAKEYSGRSIKRSYDRKERSLVELCQTLGDSDHGLTWGWGRDEKVYHKDVLYLDLPGGQVSWHSTARLYGPDYPGGWDGSCDSEDRIIQFAMSILAEPDGTTK